MELTLNWWQAILLLIVLGIWGEWRNLLGFNKGFHMKVDEYMHNYNYRAIDNYLRQLRNENPETQYEVLGMYRLAHILIKKGLIKIDYRGYIHGYKGKKVQMKVGEDA